MGNNEMWSLGFFVGLLVSGILFIILFKIVKKDSFIRCRYDERQQLVRGRGFKYGFFGCMIFGMIYILSDVGLKMQYMDTSMAVFLCIMIGAVIYVVYSIWNEAYFSLNENPKRITLLLTAVGVLNIVCSIYRIHEGLFENGVLTFINGSNLICGICILIILVVLIIKNCSDQRKAEK